ncbi:FAD:protein FMN transferase [Roseococcus sp. YIM B11640]|uniref:FAD:protein FMN transferase n=1 Tax=Roseococcus sp. YIM B11640 TaxID=3133973 RepID=UPI003C7C000F
MGTTWSVRYVGGPEPEALRTGIEAVLARIVGQMSGWESGSDICRFNAAAPGTWHGLPEDFAAVLRCALEIAAETGGAFDPTMGTLTDLWGFGPRAVAPGLPDPMALASALAHRGWERLRLDGHRLLQPGGVALDFCGIAKGHAVDLVAETALAAGAESLLADIGGELRGHGVKPDGSPWWVGLEAVPGAEAEGLVVALHGLSVATSGEYRRHFDHDGRRYAHTLDPRSGWPVAHDLASVTVLHPSCMRADALATALTVLGPEAGMQHATRHGLRALFVTRGGDETMSPALEAMLD